MSTKSSHVRIALVAATFLALAACGNKGPLVMPQKPVPVETRPATPPAQTEPASPAAQSSDPAQTQARDDGGQ